MSDQDPTRRELITGRILQRDDTPEEESNSDAPQSVAEQGQQHRQNAYVEHYSQRAMACLFEFIYNLGQYETAADVSMLAFEELERLEEQMSIYREWSELSRINRQAAHEWIEVETGLYELIKLGAKISDDSGGAFDITSTPLSNTWGFSKREGRVPTAEELDAAKDHVGMRFVTFDDDRQAIRFDHEGVMLNLGGIGKGHALDLCVRLVTTHGLADVLSHGGQSSIVARGKRSRRHQTERAGWTVGLSHPVWPEKRLAEFDLVDRALGTSGTGRQSFYHQGKKYGHIIDPRTGQPAEGILSSTVLAPTAAQADALATAFYVGGISLAQSYCDLHDDIAALIVTPGDRRGEVTLHPFGLDDDQWRQTGDTIGPA